MEAPTDNVEPAALGRVFGPILMTLKFLIEAA
jgi:hypothetical protein